LLKKLAPVTGRGDIAHRLAIDAGLLKQPVHGLERIAVKVAAGGGRAVADNLLRLVDQRHLNGGRADIDSRKIGHAFFLLRDLSDSINASTRVESCPASSGL